MQPLKYNKDKLLDDVFQQYCQTRESHFDLPAEKTVTGKTESYKYEFEDLGKCGGSALFIYFFYNDKEISEAIRKANEEKV